MRAGNIVTFHESKGKVHDAIWGRGRGSKEVYRQQLAGYQIDAGSPWTADFVFGTVKHEKHEQMRSLQSSSLKWPLKEVWKNFLQYCGTMVFRKVDVKVNEFPDFHSTIGNNAWISRSNQRHRTPSRNP